MGPKTRSKCQTRRYAPRCTLQNALLAERASTGTVHCCISQWKQARGKTNEKTKHQINTACIRAPATCMPLPVWRYAHGPPSFCTNLHREGLLELGGMCAACVPCQIPLARLQSGIRLTRACTWRCSTLQRGWGARSPRPVPGIRREGQRPSDTATTPETFRQTRGLSARSKQLFGPPHAPLNRRRVREGPCSYGAASEKPEDYRPESQRASARSSCRSGPGPSPSSAAGGSSRRA